MAYKFQLGAAKLSGSSTYKGAIEAEQSNITAVQVSSSGNMTATGQAFSIQAASDVKFQQGLTVVIYSEGAAPASQELKFEAGVDDQSMPELKIYRSGSGTTKALELGNTNGQNDYFLKINNSAGASNWKINSAEADTGQGTVSGSGNLTCNGSATFAGAVTVRGNLTVDGTTVALSSSTVTVSGKFPQVKAGATNDAQSRNSGFLFGQASQAYGGLVQYVSSALEGRHIAFRNADSTGAALKISELRGDGSALTGISSSPSYEINEVSASGGAGEVIPTILQERTNVITNNPVSPGTQHRVMLTRTGSATIGKVTKVKLQATADDSNYVKIEGHMNDIVRIDDADNASGLLLMSPSASVDLIYLGVVGGSGSYAIF